MHPRTMLPAYNDTSETSDCNVRMTGCAVEKDNRNAKWRDIYSASLYHKEYQGSNNPPNLLKDDVQ
eukprot:3441564-Amphidinium_carterae.1